MIGLHLEHHSQSFLNFAFASAFQGFHSQSPFAPFLIHDTLVILTPTIHGWLVQFGPLAQVEQV
jgi:hypothetical protein